MNWNLRFARRTASMRRNAVRELLKLTAQPDMISFAGGLPAPECFPVEMMRVACDKVLSERGSAALQYGETEGVAELRDWVAKENSTARDTLQRENVLIVTGAQQGLDLIGRVLLDEGDRVLVESPTYLALLSAWRPLGVCFRPLASDQYGVRPDGIVDWMGQQPKLIYLTPNCQNPKGTTLSLERRMKLASALHQHDLALVEDDPYGLLRFDGEHLPSIFELCRRHNAEPSRVVRTGTFSKVLAPGLRVGWVIAEAEVIDRLVRAKQSADLHTSTFNQYLILEMVRSGIIASQLPRLCGMYRERRDEMLKAMEQFFPDGVEWTRPEGGMFLLVTLPVGMDAGAVLEQSVREKVAFVPGEDFHLNGEGRNTFRLNFSNASPAKIRLGIQRLGNVLTQLLKSVELAVING